MKKRTIKKLSEKKLLSAIGEKLTSLDEIMGHLDFASLLSRISPVEIVRAIAKEALGPGTKISYDPKTGAISYEKTIIKTEF